MTELLILDWFYSGIQHSYKKIKSFIGWVLDGDNPMQKEHKELCLRKEESGFIGQKARRI